VNSRPRVLACGIGLLLAGGAALKPLLPPSSAEIRDGAWSLAGGFRPLAADWFWLQADLAWERRDAAGVRDRIGLTLAANPRSQYFWLNSARMLAYDLPAWDDDARPGVAPGLRAYRVKAAAEEALRLLECGLRWHPESAALQLEMGNICLYALGDRARAAEHYRMAAAQAEAPDYAARIYRRLREAPR